MVDRGDNTDPNGGQQSSSENRSNEDPVGLSRQSVRDHVGDNSIHEAMGENPFGFSQLPITQRVGNNYDQVMEGLDQIDGRSDMDDGEVVVKTFQALTVSRNGLNRAYCSVSARLKCQFLMFISILVFRPEGQIWNPVRRDTRIYVRRILNAFRINKTQLNSSTISPSYKENVRFSTVDFHKLKWSRK